MRAGNRSAYARMPHSILANAGKTVAFGRQLSSYLSFSKFVKGLVNRRNPMRRMGFQGAALVNAIAQQRLATGFVSLRRKVSFRKTSR
jgi:hypothetical protein